jgi:hypothetical protein
MKVLIALGISLLSVACVKRQATVLAPEPEPEPEVIAAPPPQSAPPVPSARDSLLVTLLSIAPMTQRGEFPAADSTLAAFANRHEGTCEAAEAGYMRALLRLSPSNVHAKAETAIPLFDSYIGSSCVEPARASEALLLRRIASDIVRHNFAADSASAEEVKKLKEQLDLAKKELDRLKMRVIPPAR